MLGRDTKIENSKYDLTQGSITRKLLLVAVPIIATQLIQMAYNLTDMFWLGRMLNGDAVAASGTAGMYLWLTQGFVMFGRMGAEIGVAQNLGAGNKNRARKFAEASLTISIVIGAIIMLTYFFARKPLIGFFNIEEQTVVDQANEYLAIVSFGVPFSFIAASITGIFTASGNSRLPFLFNAIGLVINVVLDPIMIRIMGNSIAGAAYATMLAQIIVGLLAMAVLFFGKSSPFPKILPKLKPQKECIIQIVKWALPIAIEELAFTFLSMIVSAIVAEFKADAIAAQRIGSQLESLSWLITIGISSAMTSFVGQNFGAGNNLRVRQGFRISSIAMAIWGVCVTLLLYFAAKPLFEVFVPKDPDVVKIGVTYLQVFAICQIFTCLEGVAFGTFRGLGRTLPPTLSSLVCNVLRTAAAFILTRMGFGLSAIWWSMTIGGIARGAWVYIWSRFSIKGRGEESAA